MVKSFSEKTIKFITVCQLCLHYNITNRIWFANCTERLCNIVSCKRILTLDFHDIESTFNLQYAAYWSTQINNHECEGFFIWVVVI